MRFYSSPLKCSGERLACQVPYERKKKDISSRLVKVTTGKKFWYGMENYSRG